MRNSVHTAYPFENSVVLIKYTQCSTNQLSDYKKFAAILYRSMSFLVNSIEFGRSAGFLL